MVELNLTTLHTVVWFNLQQCINIRWDHVFVVMLSLKQQKTQVLNRLLGWGSKRIFSTHEGKTSSVYHERSKSTHIRSYTVSAGQEWYEKPENLKRSK